MAPYLRVPFASRGVGKQVNASEQRVSTKLVSHRPNGVLTAALARLLGGIREEAALQTWGILLHLSLIHI